MSKLTERLRAIGHYNDWDTTAKGEKRYMARKKRYTRVADPPRGRRVEMTDEVKGYEGNKGMSKDEAEKRLREAGGLEAFGFGSEHMQSTEGRVETDVTEVRPVKPLEAKAEVGEPVANSNGRVATEIRRRRRAT